jgi:hypothetical protein
MPGYDRTGPMGAGPGSGWALGRCGIDVAEGLPRSRGVCRGTGRGGAPRGGGRGGCFGGRGMGWHRTPFTSAASLSPLEESEALKAQLTAATNEIAAMKARLEELEKKG